MISGSFQLLSDWTKSLRRRRETRRLRDKYAGHGCLISPRAQILGWQHIRLGRNIVLADDVWLNVNDYAAKDPAIVIGDNTLLGRRNFLSAGRLIEIGAYCLTGVDCHFLGADHSMDDPGTPYLFSPVHAVQEIRVGANCWFGSRVTVLAGVTIGHGSVVGANALVTRSLPPFSLSVGFPAAVIKRYSFPRKRWVPVGEFTAEDEAALPAGDAYLEALRITHPAPKIPGHAACAEFGDL